MVTINNPQVSAGWARAVGLVLSVSGLATGWILLGELHTPSPARAGPWVFYPLFGLLGLIILVALIQGPRMLFARRPESLRLPTSVLWLGAMLLVGSAALQVFLLIDQPDLGSVWLVILGLGGALGAVQLIRRRATNKATDPDPLAPNEEL